MTQPTAGSPEVIEKPRLRRRDWVLLPAVCLITIVFWAASVNSVASWLYPSSETGLEGCFVKENPAARAIPNSVCSERIVESRYVAEYKFNSCGHRAGMECGPKSPGAYRIVMIGSSMAMGLVVPREMTFAALLPAELSEQTGRKVEVYNESTGGEFRGGLYPTPTSSLHFDEILSANPDMILWVITPGDIMAFAPDKSLPSSQSGESRTGSTTPQAQGGRLAIALQKIRVAIAEGRFMQRLSAYWDATTASQLLEHFLYQYEGQDQYVKSFLKDENIAGYLRIVPNAKWQHSIEMFQDCVVEMENEATASHVPLVAVLVPDRAQTAMISMGDWPAGYEPYKLDNELRATVESHGGIYVDILPELRTIPNPERHYYPVNGHPDPEGHAMIAQLLAKELTTGEVPVLRPAAAPQVASAKAK